MVSDLSDQQLSLLESSKALNDFESAAQEINHYRQQILRLEDRLRKIISSYLDQHGRLELHPVENLTFADEEMLEVYKEEGNYFVKTMVNFNAHAWKYALDDSSHITLADLLSIGERVAKISI